MRYLFIVLFGVLLGGPLGFVLAVFLCYFLMSNRGTVRGSGLDPFYPLRTEGSGR